MVDPNNLKRTSIPNTLKLIVAVDSEGGFAKDGKIPFKSDDDLKHFQQTTADGVCVMGRKTYLDLVSVTKYEHSDENPSVLHGREVFVLSSKDADTPGATKVGTIREAIGALEVDDHRNVWICGGYHVYIESLPYVDTVVMTIFNDSFGCDSFFPVGCMDTFTITDGKSFDDRKVVTYSRPTHGT